MVGEAAKNPFEVQLNYLSGLDSDTRLEDDQGIVGLLWTLLPSANWYLFGSPVTGSVAVVAWFGERK